MKKWLSGITLGLLLIMGGCADDGAIQEELSQVLEANTLLTTETEELQLINEKLLETNEQLEKDHKSLNAVHEELTGKLAFLDDYEQKTTELEKEHSENIETFNDEITKLKGENKEFSDKIAAAEQKEKEIAAAKQKEAAAATASKQQTQSASGTSSTNSSSNTSSASGSAKTSQANAETPEVKQDCNIKGSSNGIYHTPGSTYYARTTKPVAMFCSVEEAQNAGYRAPKR